MYEVKLFMPVSIPQAVSTVATESNQWTSKQEFLWVSIPQAVSTVATLDFDLSCDAGERFNTASGKHCCNLKQKIIIDT